jgi:hypothetical protein
MWEDLTAGMCVLGFTAAITVVLIELPAVLNCPPIVADQLTGGRRRGRVAVTSSDQSEAAWHSEGLQDRRIPGSRWLPIQIGVGL